MYSEDHSYNLRCIIYTYIVISSAFIYTNIMPCMYKRSFFYPLRDQAAKNNSLGSSIVPDASLQLQPQLEVGLGNHRGYL